MKARLIAASLLAGLASAAAAQGGESVEGAQSFLASVMPAATMRLGGADVDGWDTPGDIETYAVSGRCGFAFSAYHAPSYDWENGTNHGTRNFGFVAAVQLTGTEVRVAYSDAAIVDYYSFTSDAMAARVARAMEFLRVNCDATSGTGF